MADVPHYFPSVHTSPTARLEQPLASCNGLNHGDSFSVGTSIRLVGLAARKYNSHIGRVIQVATKDGRVGVELHGVAWAAADQSLPARNPHRLALKPGNLRLCPGPSQRPASTTVLGTLPASCLRLILGERGWGLPFGIVESVAEHLSILRVSLSDVSVVGCSSTRGDFPIGCVLDDSEGKWWISDEGAFVNGCGHEFLEFSFGAVPRRVSFVGISIPPMPNGPLSVRSFHLETLSTDILGSECWRRVQSDSLMTIDIDGLQEFSLVPPVEATKIRVCCTKNAIADVHSEIPEKERLSRALAVPASVWCVGLFKVRFA